MTMHNAFFLGSSSFQHEGMIPVRHTCDGEDVSPQLQWLGEPPGTKSLALVMDDPDAPDPKAPTQTWVHWVLYNIPAQAHALDEGITPAKLPEGTLQGLNDWRRTGYGGPCPPTGRHRYFFQLYALDIGLPELTFPTKPILLNAMHGHVLASAELMGTYQRNP
ncbi:conserved hypothetical protein [sediment metagenome]|uniref:YbhB/YbcL family Raf kinase inhibitor-like protein n=1 Tax=sediment metagenome TaxID=749907 RepID=D9PLJ7_9ZZZZ